MSASNEKIGRALLATLSQDGPTPLARERVLAALCAGSVAVVASTAANVAAGVAATSATIAEGAGTGAGVAGSAAGSTITAAVALKSAATTGALGIAKAALAGALAAVVIVQVGDKVIAPLVTRPSQHIVAPLAPEPAPIEGPPPRSSGESLPILPPQVPLPSDSPIARDDRARAVSPAAAVPTARVVPSPDTREPKSAWTASPAEVTSIPRPAADAFEPSSRAMKGPALLDEIRHLDRARAALRQGAMVQAAQELDKYDADFPQGALRPEATVVRIEVLVKMGDYRSARALGQAFALAYPASGHLSKIRLLLAADPRPPSP